MAVLKLASLLTVALVSAQDVPSSCVELTQQQVDAYLFQEFNRRLESGSPPTLAVANYGVTYNKDNALKFFERDQCIFKFANDENLQKLVNQQIATIIAEKQANGDFSSVTVDEFVDYTNESAEHKIPTQSYLDQFSAVLDDQNAVICENEDCCVDEFNFYNACKEAEVCSQSDDDCVFADVVTTTDFFPTTDVDDEIETGSGWDQVSEEVEEEESDGLPTWVIIVLVLVVVIIVCSIVFAYLLWQDSKKEQRQVTVKETNTPDFS